MVPTSIPALQLTTITAASAADTASSTSPTKSKYPGVSKRFIFIPPESPSYSTGTKEVLMEKPLFISSLS